MDMKPETEIKNENIKKKTLTENITKMLFIQSPKTITAVSIILIDASGPFEAKVLHGPALIYTAFFNVLMFGRYERHYR